MKRFEEPTFERAEIEDIVTYAERYKERGWAFVQICATTLEDSCDLLYAYNDPTYEAPGMEGIIVNIPDGTKVPSITGVFPAAFVFENETHDLFGIDIENINIDFGGEFYTVAVAYPMNPRAAVGNTSGEEVDNG